MLWWKEYLLFWKALLVNIYCFGSSVYNVVSLSEIYTGSIDARDLQVQIKIAIENSLLSKIPYETILYLQSWRCQLWIWRSQMQFSLKRIFATVKSTIDTDNSSNTVLLFLFLWNSSNVYTLVWKHTNKWRNIYTFQIPSAKLIVM